MLMTAERHTTTTTKPTAVIGRPIDFVLPAVLEAHEPPEARGLARDDVRLLVTGDAGRRVAHATFRDLPRFLEAGDLIVVNDSATLPAALPAVRADGSSIALHLSNQVGPDTWIVEPRKVVCHAGERLSLPAGGTALLLAPHHGSPRLWRARVRVLGDVFAYLSAHGRPIAYPYVRQAWPIEMYQTVFAAHPGSAEMPSAGRAFSARVIDALGERGVGIAPITLHTGVASLESHEPPYEEWFAVPANTAARINATRSRGGRVVAVGTTVIRALESASAGRVVAPAQGWTALVITPERAVRTVDALITGFHEPKASHLSMLEALAGREHLERAYDAALAGGYLWHEFGDLHLIL
jgi:S-adenosylmethionine:tRNA ribosyltransferase-isomerase